MLSTSECTEALGMENYHISNSSIQASSHYHATFLPSYGRLHSSTGAGSWGVAINNEHQWLQVDFGNWTRVSAISTQGRAGGAQWVRTYRVSYSYDGLLYADYKEGPDAKVFIAHFVITLGSSYFLYVYKRFIKFSKQRITRKSTLSSRNINIKRYVEK